MVRSVLLIFFCILILSKVSLQETIQRFIGGFAVFPCNSGTPLKAMTAHWRYNDSLNVYDILNGVESIKEQYPVYKGRAEVFPAEYMKGNFTLRLKKLRNSDVGMYCCFIPEKNNQLCTELQITEIPKGMQERPSSNRGLESRSEGLLSLFISLISFTFLLYV